MTASAVITAFSVAAIAIHLVLRFVVHASAGTADLPLIAAILAGGTPLIIQLSRKFLKREFGSDLLGGISILTSIWLGEYLAGSIIVLMLSGGETLESYAVRSASSVLAALARRMPSVAHRQADDGIRDVAIDEVRADDRLLIYPHEICPVDGIVIAGHGVMDESYLTGEPFDITKTTGSRVLSGSINGESALTIRATLRAADSRYAKIMNVLRESEQARPQLRRLGDTLGAYYTPVALALAFAAWAASGDPVRFLSVLVIATPCPLLIAIPVAIIGSISLCARYSIVVKNPVALEQIATCRTAIFDKTGTLTYGEPTLTELIAAEGFVRIELLAAAASLERYSKHPLARAILAAAEREQCPLADATDVSEPAGKGMQGSVNGKRVGITSRKHLEAGDAAGANTAPASGDGLECLLTIDGRYAAVLRFRDAPRPESRSFVQHLGPKHQFHKMMIVSGDRETEVRYLAERVGITEIHAAQSPEQKLAIVRVETAAARTLYVGDGINDAPAMMAATVGMAIGENSDVAAEAAGVVVLENNLRKVDEFMHISQRMRAIALQSAIGGMILSVVGMGFAAAGLLSPVNGAVAQEVIDVFAVLNALRAAYPPAMMHDY